MFRGGVFKLLWSPEIDSKELIPPAYVAWQAGMRTLFLLGSWPPRDWSKIPAKICTLPPEVKSTLVTLFHYSVRFASTAYLNHIYFAFWTRQESRNTAHIANFKHILVVYCTYKLSDVTYNQLLIYQKTLGLSI